MEDDDTFYRSLLSEVYADQSPSAGTAQRSGPPFPGEGIPQGLPPFPGGSPPQDPPPSPGGSTPQDPPPFPEGSTPQDPPPFPGGSTPQDPPSFSGDSISQDPPSFPANAALSGSLCLQSLSPEQYNDIPVSRRLLIIGKSPRECDICLKSDTVSRIHARIERVSDTYYLTDLFSTNGTFLDGRKLEPNHASPIPPGAEIRIAGYRYRANL